MGWMAAALWAVGALGVNGASRQQDTARPGGQTRFEPIARDELVWSHPGTVRNGGALVLHVGPLQPGAPYVLTVWALCRTPASSDHGGRRGRRRRLGGRRTARAVAVQSFGLDFRVRIDGQGWVPVDLGLDRPEQTQIPFWATSAHPRLELEDRTETAVNVKCTVGRLAVRTP